MIHRNLSLDAYFVPISGAISAGTSDTQTLTEVDMKVLNGYDSLCVIVYLGTVTSTGVATLTVKSSDTSGTYGSGTIDTLTSDGTTVVSASGTTGDSNKLLIWDGHRLTRRYARAQVARATANVAIVGAVAILYNGHHKPSAQASANVPSTGLATVGNPIPSAA